ncbi:MAG: LysR family transcriptional regulator [Ramlibacter sp.]|nr:LysR family transcriptional regulator [Ramlibacter sp.]
MSSNRNVELHLLACLDALLQERQVTRAAERMNMSQPGMSNALARLRQKLDDPLLVRTAHGMVPTERAMQLQASVRAALRHVDAAFAAQSTFDPATARNTFKIAMSDYVSMLFMPSIMDTIVREAPSMRVVLGPSDALRLRERLEEDGFNLCIGYYTEMPEDLHVSDIFTDTISCIARAGHPVFKGSIELGDYVKQPHILMVGGTHTTTVEAKTDAALKELGQSRNIVMWMPNQLTLPALVASSDLIATVPTELARRSQFRSQLQVLDLPFEVPDMRLSMVWHELTHHDAAHRWLRQKFREVAAGLSPPATRQPKPQPKPRRPRASAAR